MKSILPLHLLLTLLCSQRKYTSLKKASTSGGSSASTNGESAMENSLHIELDESGEEEENTDEVRNVDRELGREEDGENNDQIVCEDEAPVPEPEELEQTLAEMYRADTLAAEQAPIGMTVEQLLEQLFHERLGGFDMTSVLLQNLQPPDHVVPQHLLTAFGGGPNSASYDWDVDEMLRANM